MRESDVYPIFGLSLFQSDCSLPAACLQFVCSLFADCLQLACSFRKICGFTVCPRFAFSLQTAVLQLRFTVRKLPFSPPANVSGRTSDRAFARAFARDSPPKLQPEYSLAQLFSRASAFRAADFRADTFRTDAFRTAVFLFPAFLVFLLYFLYMY